MSFKIGDRVRIRQWDDMEKEFGINANGSIKCCCTFTTSMKILCGRKATIREISGKSVRLGFDNPEDTIRWSYSTDMIEPINETIVIYRKDRETIALNKATGEKAVAKCSPEDKYDFLIGAKLAFDRLANEDIAIGDYVEVVDKGENFSAYYKWEGLKGYEAHYVKNKAPVEGKIYKVLNIAEHGASSYVKCCLIQDPDTTQVFIIGLDGVKKSKR